MNASTDDLCVVLDIDDTLYLERDYIRSGFQAVEEIVGVAGLANVAWSLFLSGARGDTFDRALAVLDTPATPGLVSTMVACYREHAPRIELQPDAGRWLHERGASVRLGCISDGPVTSQEAKVTALALDSYIADIVLTSRYGHGFGKPHTRAFEDITHRTGLSPGRHIYVADNPLKDFDGPQQLGWRTVRVRREASLHESVPTPSFVDREITDFRDLDAALNCLLASSRSDR